MNNLKDVTRQIALKWLNVPLGITIVLGAGCVLNLKQRWEDFISDQGYDHSAHNWLFLSVLLGYFGCFPGFVIHYSNYVVSYAVSIICALIGFIGLGICSTYDEPSGLHLMATLIFMVIACFSSGNAVVTATVAIVRYFYGRTLFLIIVLMVGYLKFGNVLEMSARYSILKGVEPSLYYPCLGVLLAFLYTIAI